MKESDDRMDILPSREAEIRLEKLVLETGELRKKRNLPDVGNRLFNLQLDTNNLCNLQCKECNVHLIRDVVHPTPMTQEILEIVADQVFPYCNDVNFAALAEPWMSPVIEDAMDLARARGVPFLQMISNALLLTERRARKLIDIQFDRLSVSTDAVTQETYARIRGAKLGKVVQNLERLKDLKASLGSEKPQVKFNFVMMRSNLHEMPAMVDFAHGLGAEIIDFRLPFLLKPQGLEDELPNRDPDLMDLMIEETRRRMEDLGLSVEQMPETHAARVARGYASPEVNPEPGPLADNTPHCDAPWGFLVIWPTGTIHPCCSPYMLAGEPMGSLREHSFAQIVTGPQYEALRASLLAGRFSDACARCKATDFLASYDLRPGDTLDVGPRLPVVGKPGPS